MSIYFTPYIMKKLFFLPLLAVLFASCSTDTIDTAQEDAVVFDQAAKGIAPCVLSISGYNTIDVSGGIGNPTVNFSLSVTQGNFIARRFYNMVVYIQPISDCEDMNSAVGEPLMYTSVVSNVAVVSPTIALKPSQLPSGCYVWRAELNNPGSSLQAPCVNGTGWYEAPLF